MRSCLVFILSFTLIECVKVCYDDLGCFSLNYPWTSPLRPFPPPASPEEIQTKLYCYTRVNPTRRYNVTLRPEVSLGGCPFNPSKTTMFVAHGFFNAGCMSWLNELKNAYLEASDANVFIVDWGQEAVMINYFAASSSTRTVAAEISRFIKYLQRKYGIEASSLHLIGHSLGAQIMGYVGKALPGTQHITGLDAAQPGFEACDKQVRLDKTDAKFVELIHTNGVPFLGLGYVFPHGHLDFYVNGGQRQPLCEASDLKTQISNFNNLKHLIVNAAQSTFSCSHNRVYRYYIDTLRPNCTLWGRKTSFTSSVLESVTAGVFDSLVPNNSKCDANSCIPMGLDTPKHTARGVFLVNTPLEAPFCASSEENEKITLEMKQSNSITNKDSTLTVGKTTKNAISGMKNFIGSIF